MPSSQSAVQVDGSGVDSILGCLRSIIATRDDELRVVHSHGVAGAGFGQAVNLCERNDDTVGVELEAIDIVGGKVCAVGCGPTYDV